MTKASHHEDVCMLIRKESNHTLEQYLQTKPVNSLLLALENVSNPHNIGAILRSAAHFGVDGMILSEAKIATSASAIRTSEGGAEYVHIYEASNFQKAMMLLKKNGYQILTTSSHAKKSLYELNWEKKVVIVFGEEAEGLSKDILAIGNTVKIPGTDNIESLNVSVAAAIILSDYYQKVKI
jgi:TrmH RNA methyltransferase